MHQRNRNNVQNANAENGIAIRFVSEFHIEVKHHDAPCYQRTEESACCIEGQVYAEGIFFGSGPEFISVSKRIIVAGNDHSNYLPGDDDTQQLPELNLSSSGHGRKFLRKTS